MASFTRLVAQSSRSKLALPTFLCPILDSCYKVSEFSRRNHDHKSGNQKRRIQLEKSSTISTFPQNLPLSSPSELLNLPRSCPGCGAFAQLNNPGNAGFYSINRQSVRVYINQKKNNQRRLEETNIYRESLNGLDKSLLKDLTHEGAPDHFSSPLLNTEIPIPSPLCNRCHDLIHHGSGTPVIHPTLQSVQDIIAESPYKYNHVYHVLDAADFPLSVIPQLQRRLSLSPQRSQNRRSKTSKFYHDRKGEMSFIITRSDLLAPTKEHVDRLMPYLLQVLRDTLGSSAKDVRLGNVRCVSSKRGWWTKQLKEDIRKRGGGGWMVGKVNVGKSSLFECVFPKGHIENTNLTNLQEPLEEGKRELISFTDPTVQIPSKPEPYCVLKGSVDLVEESLQENSLLPPAPPENPFPVMPVVSSLPGTTASPIRLPFGGGKGELIDLPGLFRSNLDEYVNDEQKLQLVMRQRLKPEQRVIKPGQSLLLGGLIRVTPITPAVTLLAYPFVPLESHVTSTEKAIGIQSQQRPSGVSNITKPNAADKMLSAGLFSLSWDVTKQRAGPLTSRAAVGLQTKVLPFVNLSTDILIEGCGWVELVTQVRKRDLDHRNQEDNTAAQENAFPVVEVFSPEGKHIGARRPMNAWLLGRKTPPSPSKRKARPRRSMKGVKKSLKMAARVLNEKN